MTDDERKTAERPIVRNSMPELFGKNPRYFVARNSYGNLDKWENSIGFVVKESHTQMEICEGFKALYEQIREKANRIYWFKDQLRKQEQDIVEIGELKSPNNTRG